MQFDSSPRYLVRCDSGMHRVALDADRYWRPAKCPSCRARMDKRQFRRMRHWFLGNAPRSAITFGSRARIIPIEGFALLFLALMVTVALLLHTVADAWWPATALLFLGRWPWLLPGIPVLLLALVLKRPRAVVTTLAAGLVALFGILDFVPGIGRLLTTPDAASRQVRVVTYNIAGTITGPAALVALVNEWEPDILAVQECALPSEELLPKLPNYNSDIGTNCLFTKFEIVRVDSLRREAFRNASGAAWVKRYRLKSPDGEFDFTNVHLDTPRKAFETLMTGRAAGAEAVTAKTEIRELESRLARLFVDKGTGPRLVAGDFNMPTESAIYRANWSGFTNGFSHSGFGFGYSRRAGWIQLRIDHVLADDGWVVQSARLLPDYGSDHLPMMVDVALKPR